MASLHDETNNQYYPLEPEVTLIIGRENPQFNLGHDHRVGRRQIELNLVEDGSCFVKRLGTNPSLLGTKLLPRNCEIQVYDGDLLKLIPVIFILPNSRNPEDRDRNAVIPPTVPTPIEGEKYYYDENNMEEYQTQQPPSMAQNSLDFQQDDNEEDNTTTDEEEAKAKQNEEEEESDGWITTESSLLGGEDWSDLEEDLKVENNVVNYNK
ncbi:hypothetical protein BDA99DRAFT_610097 [Phascolomyces articulosus]|uniref:FHA domain-containing protein n=1 Tax=Phascolomyces articulosus TaxID=60185 RepID=A0AAD5JZW0_9FUNG|nr:hypothetical protein BDA99DRAFT_610097 [Phascolomyces articulosus]